MKRAQLFVVAVILGGCTTLAAAQSRPDFTGRWTTDPDPASAPATGPGRAGQPPDPQRGGAGRVGGRGDMGSGWGSTITITQDAAKLVVEYAFFGRGDMQPPLKFIYALDGSETRNTVMMGRGIQDQVSTATWQGDKLVITTIHAVADPDSGKPASVEVKRVLSLESPAALVVETTRTATFAGPPGTTRTIYRKL